MRARVISEISPTTLGNIAFKSTVFTQKINHANRKTRLSRYREGLYTFEAIHLFVRSFVTEGNPHYGPQLREVPEPAWFRDAGREFRPKFSPEEHNLYPSVAPESSRPEAIHGHLRSKILGVGGWRNFPSVHASPKPRVRCRPKWRKNNK